jgi:ABC-2 type transport system ATP-binding protein
MLKIQKISKKFGKIMALAGVSFEAKRGEIIGLLGPNGAGKTTLLRVLAGFYLPDGGEIFWNREKVDTRSREHHQRLGYLPENNPLYPNLTVNEYLTMVANLKSVKNGPNEIMTECKIDDVGNKKIETLSKGYRQRVGLAAALAGNPELLILDEATSGLDPRQVLEIRKLIKRLAKNKVVIFSTHILSEVRELCDQAVIIDKGKIVLDEKTAKIRNLEKKFIQLTS